MYITYFAALCAAYTLLEAWRNSQTTAWKIYDIQLTAIADQWILVELLIGREGTPALLTASKNANPQAGFDRDGHLRVDAMTADYSSFAYQSQSAFLTTNSSGLERGGQLIIGVLLSQVPIGGVNVTLKVTSHSTHYPDGELCPWDCSDHGACHSGSCSCESTWVGASCSQRAVEMLVNESKDLIVSEKAYLLVQVSYAKSQNLGINANVVQGEAVLLVSYGA